MTNLDNFLSLPIITQRNRRGTGLDSQGIVILCHLSQISLLFGYFILKRMQKGPQCQELSRFKAGLWQSWQSERGYSLLSSNVCHQDGKNARGWRKTRPCVAVMCSVPSLPAQQTQNPSQPSTAALPACQQLSCLSLSQTHTRVRKQGSGVPLSRGIEELQASFPLFLYRVLQLVERGRREAVPLNFPWHFNQAWILKIKKLFAKISVI